MIIQCPNCRTRYNFDESNLKPEGITMRCSKCGHVFRHPPEDAADTVEEHSPLAGEDQNPAGQDDEIMSENLWQAGEDEIGGAEDQEGETDWDDEPDTFSSGQEQEEEEATRPSDLRIDFEPEGPSGRNKFLIWTLLLVLVFSVALALWLYYPLIRPHLPAWMGGGAATSAVLNQNGSPVPDPNRVKGIVLDNVRQYVVNNEKVGRLFVVEGKAINRFPGAKELIKIRVDLMDKNKKPVLSRDFYCGNTVTLFQLQVYTAEELDAALNAKTGILNNNTNLDPGDEAPFMIVVPNPPDSVKEFQVMVVDARDAVPVES